MKKKILVIVIILALYTAGWNTIFSSATQEQEEYDTYLNRARQMAEKGLDYDAMLNYSQALTVRDTVALRAEIAQYYLDRGEFELLEEWAEEMIETYPRDPEGYEYLAIYQDQDGLIGDCLSTIISANQRAGMTQTLTDLYAKYRYAYYLSGNVFSEVQSFVYELCPVMNSNGYWGYLDTAGSMQIPFQYQKAEEFLDSGLAPVHTQEGEYILIDTAGNKRGIDEVGKEFEEVGPLSGGLMAAMLDGSWMYLDRNFATLGETYEEAAVMNGGISAVKRDGKWLFLTYSGEQIGSETFDIVCTNRLGVAFWNGIAFAGSEGSLSMYGREGEKISEETFEDAKLFASSQPAAAKKNGLWGFVDASGAWVIEPQYEDACSFASGYAAVKQDGLWGFINEQNELVIEPAFLEADVFNGNGGVMVRTQEGWRLLRLYVY